MVGSTWQVLRDLQAGQIMQIPHRAYARQDSATDQDQADRGASQRLQALVSAFHYAAPVAFGWIRERPGGSVRVLAAGPALAGNTDSTQTVLTLPARASDPDWKQRLSDVLDAFWDCQWPLDYLRPASAAT